MPFVIEAYTESCDAKLKVIALEAGGKQAEQAVCDAAINNVRPLGLTYPVTP